MHHFHCQKRIVVALVYRRQFSTPPTKLQQPNITRNTTISQVSHHWKRDTIATATKSAKTTTTAKTTTAATTPTLNLLMNSLTKKEGGEQ
eukprot:7206921-Ditylum_brightwellii.AAC.1